MSATPSSVGSVVRDGYAGFGDAPSLAYVASGSRCSLNGGAGDGGSQVPTSDGKCWIAVFAANGADIRLWGAKDDGRTDAQPAISKCLAARTSCVVPEATNGFYIAETLAIPDGGWLVGTISGGDNAYSTFTYRGSSWLRCKATIIGPCVQWGSISSLHSGGLRNLVISKDGAPAIAGQDGVVFQGGYNIRFENMVISNFSRCAVFERGISGQGISNYLQQCTLHYWVFDTWPEFSQVGGRAGSNGFGNPNTALDDVYFTSTIPPGGGGTGPNSIDFITYAFENDQTQCTLRWGNFIYPPGDANNFHFTNMYKEVLATGTSFLCSDATVPLIGGLRIENSYISQDIGSADFSSGLNPATELSRWTISGNLIGLSGVTLAPTATGGIGFDDVHFANNLMPEVTVTPGGGTMRRDSLSFSGDSIHGALTIGQGAHGWQNFAAVGITPESIVDHSDHYNVLISTPHAGISSGYRAVSTLPPCNASYKGFRATVTDSATATFGASVTGGGSHFVPVLCDGSAWLVM